MIKGKMKSQKGFTTMDATIAIIIITISLGLITTVVYNNYTQILSTHKNSMATFYAVEVLEQANKLEYDDIYLSEGIRTSEQDGTILDIPIDSSYTVNLNISKYNNIEGNIDKQDLIKILEVIVKYTDNNIEKNISIKTLKLSM